MDPITVSTENSLLDEIKNENDQENGNVIPQSDDIDVDVSSLEQRIQTSERFLFSEVVKSHLGERASAIVNLLISLGRLSVHEIHAKLSSNAKDNIWTVRSIKATIVSLIQLRCVKYFEETSLSGKKITYYYYNEDGILLLLYSGLIINEISNLFPTVDEDNTSNVSASQVIQNVLSLGSISLDQYIQSSNSNSSNFEISDIFVKLCENGFLIPISKLHYTPINDLWNLLYNKQYNAIPRKSALSDLKKRTEAKTRAKEEFLELMNTMNDPSKALTLSSSTSMKTVKKDIPLTFNLDRFLKTRRSNHLVQFAKFRISSTSARVYKAALKMTEKRSVDLIYPLSKTDLMQDIDESKSIEEEVQLLEEKGVTFNAIELSRYLPTNLNLRGSLVSEKKDLTNNNKRSNNENDYQEGRKKLKTKDGFVIPQLPKHVAGSNVEDEEDEDMDATDDNSYDSSSTVGLLNQHLRLLSTSSIPFLRETRPGVYHVPYSTLMPLLRSSIYDYIIASTLGQSAMRIRRCICANSLVSEKVINSVALMKEKDIRTTIASLIKFNVVEIQEVPRTMDRSAARAVFLFRSKESHSYSFMKQNLEWNIANLIFKKEKLKEENFTLLTKANREDVKGNESNLLLSSELNQLKMVNERELATYSRVCRVISLWEVFRFY